MTKTQVLQEIRRMRFKEAYGGWQERRLTAGGGGAVAGGVRAHIRAPRDERAGGAKGAASAGGRTCP